MTVTAEHLFGGSAVMVPGFAERPRGRARPSKGDLEYVKVTIELLLLLLAVPWLLKQLARDPRGTSRQLGKKHLAS